MKEEYNIYEYPHKELKEEEFYAIILIGDNKENLKFINKFLNYIYYIKKGDKKRLKYENKKR